MKRYISIEKIERYIVDIVFAYNASPPTHGFQRPSASITDFGVSPCLDIAGTCPPAAIAFRASAIRGARDARAVAYDVMPIVLDPPTRPRPTISLPTT